MATCFELNNNVLVPTNNAVDTCTGFILNTVTEHQSNITIETLFAIPADSTQLVMLFSAGFILPVFAYVTAWTYGVALNFIAEKT